jgi:hypothetical protein
MTKIDNGISQVVIPTPNAAEESALFTAHFPLRNFFP